MSYSQNPIAIVGGSGLIGAAVARALEARGFETREVSAPRLRIEGPGKSAVLGASLDRRAMQQLTERLGGAAVVVNAAGLSTALERDDAALLGANALLPRLLLRTCAEAGVSRLLHVSSSSVQGGGTLDESRATAPFSGYSFSKAIGEQVLLDEGDRADHGVEVSCFRPTSVHAPSRQVTKALIRFARSPLSSVAGSGGRPTPQVLLANVADAIAFTALHRDRLPEIVLQPWEGLTCSEVLRILGSGREPRQVPAFVASRFLTSLRAVERRHGALPGLRRRLEMMWWGQAQHSGWLESQGWQPEIGLDGWHALAAGAPAQDRS